jgi:hypothetical protein
MIKPVYRVVKETKMVIIIPGINPRTEYDQGNDKMAKQMYSENNRPAVFCQEQDLYLMS